MKILEVTNVDFALLHFILPLMRGLRDRGHEVVGVCADGPLLAVPRAEGFRVVPVALARSLHPLRQARALAELVAVMRAEKPDLVHAHMPISGLLARTAARIAGVPRIAYTCHGFLFNQPGPWWRGQLSLALERAAGRITDTYLTVSAEEAEDARRLRIHRNPVAVLNGRDPARFHPDPEARARLRAEMGVTDQDCVVVAISRLVRHKGFAELLAAMADTPPNCVLWVAGERLASDHGEDLTPLFERAAATLGRRLVVLGYRTDVPALLAASDVFTLPSHFEGLPMSIIEAMLTGLPVVATDIRGPREQVVPEAAGLLLPEAAGLSSPEVTGILVPPMQVAPLARALSRLAGDVPLRQAMGAAGQARALALFDEVKVLRHTIGLLESGVASS